MKITYAMSRCSTMTNILLVIFSEYLCKALYLSVDPYMRPYMIRYPVGTTMIGAQVAE